MVIAEKAALSKLTWRYLVIDEAHRIKNEQGLLSKARRLPLLGWRWRVHT